MAKSQTPALPPAVCSFCGKPLRKNAAVVNGMGATCAKLVAMGYTPASIAKHIAGITIAQTPKGFITVASLHKKLVAAKVPGATVGRMVQAIGGDRAGLLRPVHAPITQPFYLPNQTRVVHGWLATAQGMQAMATFSYGQAPAVQAPVILGTGKPFAYGWAYQYWQAPTK